MAKDPAFLFYPGDYLRDTQCLGEKAQVVYDRIMCEHMRNICISQERLNFFTKRLSADEVAELHSVLTECEGGFMIDWVAESICKRKAYSESRRENRQGKPKEHMKTYVPHMENANENKDENVKEKKDGTEKPKNGKSAEASTVLKYFSEATGIRININADSHVRHVIARLNEGITIDEMKMVIDFKIVEWTGTDYEKHITPKTLFGTKCSDYIIQVNRAIKNGWTKDQIKGAKKGINEGLTEGVEAIYRARAERERSDNLRAANAQEG